MNATYFKSKAGGLLFHRHGEHVTAICTYEWNPSIERHLFSEKLFDSLNCEAIAETEYLAAANEVANILLNPNHPNYL